MADLRLVGRQLAAVRRLAENPLSRQALWALVSRDFRVAELAARPARDRGHVEELPRPVQGAPPRSFGQELDAAPPAPGSAAEIRAAYVAGAITPREVCERLLDRIDRRDFGPSTFSPFVALDREGLEAAAEGSTVRYREERALGPLDGIPVPVKDEFHMRGLPTRGGTVWNTETHDVDAVLVERLREGGAMLPGKSHVVEHGLNPLGFNPHFAEYPRNVYTSGHGAGGSSTGSAVCVGLGLAPAAVATDGGGSIRVPAAMNGIFGLKPTFNRISRTGDIWAGTVGHTGPVGRTASDLVDFLEVAAARDPADPLTHFAPDWDTVVPTWRAALRRSLKGCRIGVLRDELADADPAIARACDEALREAERAGAILQDLTIPLLPMANAVGPIVIAGEGMANASDDIAAHREQTGDEIRMIHGLMQCLSAQEHLLACRTRSRLRAVMAEAIAGFDLLALPAHARLAAPYPLSESGVEVADTAWTASMTRFNFMGNLTGLPAASIPVGMSEGLPIGLQIVGDAWDEASVIAACAAFERLEVTALLRSPGYRSLLG